MKTGLDKPEHLEEFKNVLIFRALSPIGQEFLFDRAQILEFEGGEKIVEYGDLSPSFFAVLEGNVHVSMKQDGNDVYINTLGVGSVFGEAAMFLKAPRTADVSSADSCVVLKLTRFDVMDFLRDHPRDGNKMLMALVYGLLLKLKSSNQELVFERRADNSQSDVDALIAELASD
jgi:CRP-like cAMP-binding protein